MDVLDVEPEDEEDEEDDDRRFFLERCFSATERWCSAFFSCFRAFLSRALARELRDLWLWPRDDLRDLCAICANLFTVWRSFRLVVAKDASELNGELEFDERGNFSLYRTYSSVFLRASLSSNFLRFLESSPVNQLNRPIYSYFIFFLRVARMDRRRARRVREPP